MPGINSQSQLAYAAIEATFGTAVPASNINAFRIISCTVVPEQDTIQRPDKNSSLSQTMGIAGLKRGTFSVRASLAGSAAAGTAPDIGPLLHAAFGKAPTIVASTSVTYALDDLSPSVTLWSYWSPSDATQYVGIGCVVSTLSIDASGTQPSIEIGGVCYWVLDTDQFATAEAAAKGGLASFPVQPVSPVTNGQMVSLFTGSALIDATALSEIRSFRLSMNFNRELPQDIIFSGLYPGAPSAGVRDVTFDLNVYDKSADAVFSTLKNKAITKSPVPVVLTFGSVAGSRVGINLANVLLGVPQVDDGARRKAITFSGCRAHATTGTSKDEVTLSYS